MSAKPAPFEHACADEAARRTAFLEGLNADFKSLRQVPAAWAGELAERRAWDAKLTDKFSKG